MMKEEKSGVSIKPHPHSPEADEQGKTGSRGKSSAPFIAALLVGVGLICAAMFYNTSRIMSAILNNTKTVEGSLASLAAQMALQAAQQGQGGSALGPANIPDRGDEPVLGNPSAKVTMVEFGDFQCPFCKGFYQSTFGAIKSQYVDTGKVKIIFRHFPLSIHQNAQISAVAAECANRQGKFWEFHDLLYTKGQSDGTNLDKASLKKYANQLGLNSGPDKNAFNQCLDGNATATVVSDDQTAGTNAGVSGTPTFFINGARVVGAQPLASFTAALDKALQ